MQKKIQIQQLAELIRHLTAALPAMQFCTVFVKRLEILKNQALSVGRENYSGIAQISDSVRQDLIRWVDNLQSSIAVSFDASKTVFRGGGGGEREWSHYRRHVDRS